MRVYLPATTSTLRDLSRVGAVGPPPLTAFAVTAGLREWYLDDSDEELEYAAMLEAARGSLRMIDSDESAAARRVVLAADIADADVTVRDDLDRGVVQVAVAVPLAAVASVHVDDQAAASTIAAAAAAVIAADLGDGPAQDAVDDAEGFELSWHANQEIPQILDPTDGTIG